jgi:hypothetical protein
MLPIVLYGYESWSLTSLEEHRVRMFEKKVLRIFGPKREEVTGGWRKLRNESSVTCNSRNNVAVFKSMRMRWAGHEERMGK